MWNQVVDRLKEPSTYAGVAVVLGLLGVHVTPEAWQGVVSLMGAVGAIAAIVVPEKAA